ncbi:hypothetical protein C0J52_15737 [Blattella germanica]|nr:hypothetical protein C0J52_15737 [Blattella germanica]
MPSCVVSGCTNKSMKKKPGITFHAFPKDPVLKDNWVKAIRRVNWTPSQYSKICSAHFAEADIDRTSLSCVRIRTGSVPSVFSTNRKKLKRREQKDKMPVIKSEPEDKSELDFDDYRKPETVFIKEEPLDFVKEEIEVILLDYFTSLAFV